MADGGRRVQASPTTKFSPTFDLQGIPVCLNWTTEDVAEWIIYLGFPQYKSCFLDNIINGRQLVTMHASSLPRIGITDFEHIKFISRKVREVLGLEEPDWNRSIALQYRERLGIFLEKRSCTGCEGDMVTYEDFNRHLDQLEIHSPFKRVTYPSAKAKTNKY